MMQKNHYDVLEISIYASQEVIKAAYRVLGQKWHPDKHPDNLAMATAMMTELNIAYGVLSDPEKKAAYDKSIKRQETPPPKKSPHQRQSSQQQPQPPQSGETKQDSNDKQTSSEKSKNSLTDPIKRVNIPVWDPKEVLFWGMLLTPALGFFILHLNARQFNKINIKIEGEENLVPFAFTTPMAFWSFAEALKISRDYSFYLFNPLLWCYGIMTPSIYYLFWHATKEQGKLIKFDLALANQLQNDESLPFICKKRNWYLPITIFLGLVLFFIWINIDWFLKF